MKCLTILCLVLLNNFCFSQQIVELCAEKQTIFEYYSESDVDGTFIWEINGQTFIGDNLNYTWTDIGDYTITLEFISNVGCVDNTLYNVQVVECPQSNMFIPNCFTPDGDGVNDFFIYKGVRVKNIYLRIFNRWGEQLYFSLNDVTGWNGKYKNEDCQLGVYGYILIWQNLEDRTFEKSGSFTLIK